MGKGIVIAWPGQTSKSFAGFPEGRKIAFTEDDLLQIEQRSESIVEISPESMRWGVELENDGKIAIALVSGVYPELWSDAFDGTGTGWPLY